MPQSRLSNPSEVNVASLNVSSTPPSAGNLTITTGETTGTFTIPAGAAWAKIRNAGFIKAGDLEADATILSATWSVGREEIFEAKLDESGAVYQKLPAISINGNGSRVFYSYAT